jgi:alkylation response protein AidB-like acyl-CoA dehydrogenase
MACDFVPIPSSVEELLPEIGSRSEEIEAAGRIPPDLIAKLVAARVFRTSIPKEFGGDENSPAAQLEAFERIAITDGATGWCVMIGAAVGFLSGYLQTEGGSEIFADPKVITGGALAPTGRATPVDGGYRVTGRWRFVSGIEHCAWLVGGAVRSDAGSSGEGEVVWTFFPAADIEIRKTWRVSGLCGTGSHDMAVHDVFVPSRRTFTQRDTDPDRRRPEALYAFPILGLWAPAVSAVGLGIARAALDEVVRVIRRKVDTNNRTRVAQQSLPQFEIARAEAELRAARALLYGTVDEAWQDILHGKEVSLRQRALLRAAAAHATASAAQVVDTAYSIAGGTSLYLTSPLQRHFRDVHGVTQHAVNARAAFEAAGRVLLGFDAGVPLL